MSCLTDSFRQGIIDDYQGALVRLATLRANGEHHLLFAWVELFPFDMTLPSGWTAGKKPWSVPGHQDWTCAFSATRLGMTEALDWYEAAGAGSIEIASAPTRRVAVHAPPAGPEPAYGQFCSAAAAPFVLPWHDNPRIHRYVPLKAPACPVRQLGKSAPARGWLERHLGFDPYTVEEWLGGVALAAPDPLCSAFGVFPSGRTDHGPETLTIRAVPRRSKARGISDLSSLSVHVGERRVGGWTSVQTVGLDASGYATIVNQQSFNQIAYALVCAKRGLLRFDGPLSWVEQVNVGLNVANSILRVEVPAGGRRKPSKAIEVQRYAKASDISVGEPLKDAVRQRMIGMAERQRAREARTNAPQRVFGIAADKATVKEAEIIRKRKEAEDFIASLVSGARRRVVFVDPFFGPREMGLFALRVSNLAVAPKLLTGLPGLAPDPLASRPWPGDLFVADLAKIGLSPAVRVPEVRVMPGGDKPVIHDRYLIVDGEVWHCGPSFNELGERSALLSAYPIHSPCAASSARSGAGPRRFPASGRGSVRPGSKSRDLVGR